MKRYLLLALVPLFAVLPALMGPTTGGFPSRPNFQAVGIGTTPSAANGTVSLKAGAPTLFLHEDDQPVDGGKWQLDSFGGQFRLTSRTDAAGVIYTPLLFSHDTSSVALSGTVKVNGATIPQIAWAKVISNAVNQGAGITSVTKMASGRYQLNFAAGLFASTIGCTCTRDGATLCSTGPGTYEISTYTLAGTPTDGNFNVTCVGS